MPKQGWLKSIIGALASLPFLWEVFVERVRQERKWGPQNHPSFPASGPYLEETAEYARNECAAAFDRGDGSWLHILDEEAFEAMTEPDLRKLRKELVQVAAVSSAWRESIDRNSR